MGKCRWITMQVNVRSVDSVSGERTGKWSETIWIFWTFADRDSKTYGRYRSFIFRWLTSVVRKVTKRDQKDKQEVMKKWSFVCLGTCYCAFTLKAGGYTIAVLGNGLDICYPSEHRILMENIAKQGLLISEYEPGIKPQKVYFPRRNRIIAAFSDEIIITSAGKGSGALITAQYGEKYHRKIWIITNDRKSSV